MNTLGNRSFWGFDQVYRYWKC